MPQKELVFEFFGPGAKAYRNRVALPAVRLRTDLSRPIVRGKSFQVEYEGPAKVVNVVDSRNRRVAVIFPELNVLAKALEAVEDPAEKLDAIAEHMAFGEKLKRGLGYRFDGEQMAHLPPGKAFLATEMWLRLPLVQPTRAGGAIFIHHGTKRVPVEIVD
jgi:hypothetical protein